MSSGYMSLECMRRDICRVYCLSNGNMRHHSDKPTMLSDSPFPLRWCCIARRKNDGVQLRCSWWRAGSRRRLLARVS